VGLWDFWTTESKNYLHGYLDASQGPAGTVNQPIATDASYVRVYLRRMWIPKARNGFSKYYGAVHSDTGAYHSGAAKVVTFKQIVAPPELKDVSASTLDLAIVTTQELFGPSPYRGGRLQLNAALLAVKSGDLAGPFLDVLTGLATAAGVAYVKMAEPFLKPLTAGIDLLTGNDGTCQREIQLVANILAPRTGVYVVMRATASDVALSDLVVGPDYSLASASGKDLRKLSYMVFSIEASPVREDWKSIPDIRAAYDAVAEAVKDDKRDEYQTAMKLLTRTASLSDDLLLPHAQTLVAQIKQQMDALFGPALTAAAPGRAVPSLDSFDPFAKS
jgi:hypothetical protein